MGRTADARSHSADPSIRQYRLHVALIPEDGAVSAVALNLPGVASFGDDEESALANFREAAEGCIASYEEAGNGIPWEPSEAVPFGAKDLWVELGC